MSGYYLAPSLAVLRAEIDTRWPRRDRASDGWIGDARHQASTSDHNPNGRGSVNAIDVDEDGVPFATVFAAIKRHPSARYVIYERRLYHRLRGWRPEPYSGSNPHEKHFHLSIDQTREAEQDRRPWGLLTNEEDEMTPAQFLAILKDPEVAQLMRALPWQYNGRGIPPEMSTLNVLNELVVTSRNVAAKLGGDLVDEPAIVAGILATLTPAAIAAAIPPGIAGQVVDELRDRLVDAEQVGDQGQARE